MTKTTPAGRTTTVGAGAIAGFTGFPLIIDYLGQWVAYLAPLEDIPTMSPELEQVLGALVGMVVGRLLSRDIKS